MMKIVFSILLAIGLTSFASSQNNFWIPMHPTSFDLSDAVQRNTQPKTFQGFYLDYQGMANVLASAPMEFTVQAKKNPLLLQLPLADGFMKLFQVWESPVMAPGLMAKYPELRTYAGKAVDGSGLTMRMDIGYNGLNVFIFNTNGHFQSVRPYANENRTYYMAYRQEDILPSDGAHHLCGTDASAIEIQNTSPLKPAGNPPSGEPVILKKYRLAASTQGEYSQHFGGTKPAILSAIVTALNFITAIQERDWAVRLELIPNTDTLFYFDPNTDPFTGPYVSNWIGSNPGAINSRINVNSYDIGHLFSKVLDPQGIYVAGQAALAGVCTQVQKSVAGSSDPIPSTEAYYLIMAHEMGHQFSATHTFNNCPPAQAQQTSETAFEPGGGSTIMSYSLTCDPEIIGATDAYFHVASIEQVQQFISQEVGSTCPELIETSNHLPEVTIPLANDFYIPISTPFQLNAQGSDIDGDPLLYCWEEFDLGPVASLGQPTGSTPTFRSLPPTSDSFRVFPKIQTVVSNGTDVKEYLPTYTRNFRFKVTVRDGFSGSGGVAIADVKFRSTSEAGPFLVSYPNTVNIKWEVGQYQTILWDVANTDKSPVNAKTVNIKLSTNNGLTYPITLATGVPNNGKYCIQVPNNVGANMRVRVEAADNVFFDISNSKFEIAQPTAGISLCASTTKDVACLPGNYTTEVSTAGLGGVTDPISLSATGLPSGATATFSPNPVQPGSSSTMTVTFAGNTAETTFDVTIEGSASAASTTSIVTLTTVGNNFSAFAPTFPLNGASGVNQQPPLKWSDAADADFYDVELATNPSFEPGVIVTSRQNVVVDSFQVNVILEAGKVYFWRVRAQNDCGEAEWSEIQAFVVAIQSCNTFEANDLPKNISANGTPTVESKITLASGGAVSDVNIKKIQGNHAFFKDLEVHLIGPGGGDALLWKDKCASFNGSFNLGMDDGAAGTFPCPPPNNGTSYKPTNPLTIFNGLPAQGVWTLRVKDNNISGGGSLAAFSLEICSNVALNPPVIVINNPLAVNSGDNAAIGDNLLKADDPNTPPANLVFTLMSLPKHGLLLINGGSAVLGSQFTQADISNGGLRYYDYGLNLGQDKFNFAVTDGDGGLATGTYVVEPFSVGTHEPNASLAFELAPNPSSSFAVLSLDQPLNSDARVTLLNAAGQVVTTWQLAAGAYALRLDLQNLPKGVYAVSLENERWKGVKKLVVQ